MKTGSRCDTLQLRGNSTGIEEQRDRPESPNRPFWQWMIAHGDRGHRNRYAATQESLLKRVDVPEILRRAIESPEWPTKPIWGSRLRHLHAMFDNFNFELLQTIDQLFCNTIADTKTLRDFAQCLGIRTHLKLTIGSQFGPSALPMLDVERALVFGGGAGIGDDFWLTLDMRGGMDDPPVVGNCFDRNGCNWVEITPSFTRFCRELSINISNENTA